MYKTENLFKSIRFMHKTSVNRERKINLIPDISTVSLISKMYLNKFISFYLVSDFELR